MVKIIEIFSQKDNVCEKILRSLPKWFGIESAILDYIKDVQSMPMLVAKDYDKIIGFLSLNLHNSKTAEIHVIGIDQSYHRQKIGTALVSAAEDYLKNRNFQFITVKTLSESSPNEEYSRTRNFYLAMGFVPLEEFKTLWGEHNPCLFLVKQIESHRDIIHTILYVADQKKSSEFYQKILNQNPHLDVPGMTEFKLSSKHILGLMPESGIKRLLGEKIKDPALANGVPRVELYIHSENPENMFNLALQLGAKELSPILERPWGGRAGYVLDFDGHVLAFAAR